MSKKMTDLIRQTRYRLANRMVSIISLSMVASLLVDLGIYVFVCVKTGALAEFHANPVTLTILGFLLSEVRHAMSGHEEAQKAEDRKEIVRMKAAIQSPESPTQ